MNERTGDPPPHGMTHIVAFRYKPAATQEQRGDFDPAHDDYKKFAIPLRSVDDCGKTNGAMVIDAVSPSRP